MKHSYPLRLLLLTLMVWGGAAPTATAVPARPRPIVVTQSDGTRLKIRIMGDERSHYVLSEEGYSLVSGPDGDFHFATLSAEGRLVPTGIKARPLKELSPDELRAVQQLRRGIRPTLPSPIQQHILPDADAVTVPTSTFLKGSITPPVGLHKPQTSGKLKSLIILAELNDRPFTVANPREAFRRLLMEDGYAENGATGSAWNYYNENSGGKFDPDFQVVGPYRVSGNSSYYASYDGTARVPELIVEACRAADADVDFSQYADNGVIRDVFVFYTGTSQAETGRPSDIWPHRWSVQALSQCASVYLDGQHLQGYACSSELSSDYYSRTRMTGIGTFCHEFGHVLGWPDFYDTDYTGSGGEAAAMEDYSLMSAGSYNNESRTPAGITLLEKWMVGWAEPETVSQPGLVELGPLSEGKGLLVGTPTDQDYFLMEYRDPQRWKWDAYIGTASGGRPQPGMMVYHIDYTSGYRNAWSLLNTLNASPRHECCKIVRAVPGNSSAYNPDRTIFPAGGQAGKLSPESHGSLYRSWKGQDPDLSFTGIEVGDNGIVMQAVLSNGIFIDLTDDGSDATRIILPEEGFSSENPIRLLCGQGTDPDQAEWYIDGARLDPEEETMLPAGEHTLELSACNAEGDRVHIIKYITVK